MTKAITIIITSAFLSILYVHQHANLIEYSYAINNSKGALGLLIDHNNVLRYNISTLESPLRLDRKIQENTQVYAYMPIDSYIIMVEKPVVIDNMIMPKGITARVSSLLLSMFALDNEAVAKEIND
jgi:hypothetical protein